MLPLKLSFFFFLLFYRRKPVLSDWNFRSAHIAFYVWRYLRKGPPMIVPKLLRYATFSGLHIVRPIHILRRIDSKRTIFRNKSTVKKLETRFVVITMLAIIPARHVLLSTDRFLSPNTTVIIYPFVFFHAHVKTLKGSVGLHCYKKKKR